MAILLEWKRCSRCCLNSTAPPL